MKLIIKWIPLNIQDLTQDKAEELSIRLSNRQKDKQFMKFLKDTPMSPTENQKVIETTLNNKNNIQKVIIEQAKQEIIGFILFDQFNDEEQSLESYTRVDPSCKGCGIGSQCRKKIIAEVLSTTAIQKIVSRHSAWNQASFIINKRAWFRLVDFIPNKTYLPNIGKTTDDFKREIHQAQKIQCYWEPLNMEQKNIQHIMQWIQKHNLFHLLTMDR